MTSGSFIERLDAAVRSNAMLSHPFYQMWSEGKLDRAILAEYAKQYYAHVRAFPTYVSATHANCDDITVRRMLLENLMEEERGDENHPELWMRFAEGLGVAREDVRAAELLDHTKESVARFKAITRRDDHIEGVAALYAYESQIPEVSRTKREGLKAFYGMDDERAVSFFRVHEQADIIHQTVEREVLAATCVTPEQQERAIAAAEQASKALWHFLDGVQLAYCAK
jgi:pyrroloquinoline-quinone synthase